MRRRKTLAETKQNNIRRFLEKYAIYVVLLGLVIILSVANNKFLTMDNITNMLRQISVTGLLSMGMGLVIISKGIDLSVGSTVAISAVVSASFAQIAEATAKFYPNLGEINVLVVVLIGILIGIIIGLINGLMIAYLRLPAFIATLSTMTVVRALALIYCDGKPISFLTPQFETIGKGYLFNVIPIPVVILIITILVTWVLLNRTRFGMNIYAIGGNEQAARVSGIKVEKNILAVYAYMGALAGLAGIVLCSRVSSGQPNFGTGYEFDAITAVTLLMY